MDVHAYCHGKAAVVLAAVSPEHDVTPQACIMCVTHREAVRSIDHKRETLSGRLAKLAKRPVL